MEYVGQVRDGVIIFEAEPPLAEGTIVRIEPVAASVGLHALGEKLLQVAGTARGLPPDLAENHDYYHYLHGQPRR